MSRADLKLLAKQMSALAADMNSFNDQFSRQRSVTDMSTTETKRPVQLQVNDRGGWKTVARTDAGGEGGEGRLELLQLGARNLWEVDPRTSWRIATAEGHPIVLRFMGRDTNGIWVSRELLS